MRKFNLFFNLVLTVVLTSFFNINTLAHHFVVETRILTENAVTVVIVEKEKNKVLGDVWSGAHWALKHEEFVFLCKLNNKIIKRNESGDTYDKIVKLLAKKGKTEEKLANLSSYSDHEEDEDWEPSDRHCELAAKYNKQIDDINKGILNILKSLVK